MGRIAPVFGDQRGVIGTRGAVSGNGLVKAGPDLGNGFGIVLQQFVLRGQAQFLQNLQRRIAHQGREPAVKSANLHAAAGFQHGAVQIAQLFNIFRRGFVRPAACQQFRAQLGIIGLGKFNEPFLQTLAHFSGGFFGERNRQNFVWLRSLQERPHNARHQHPRFSRPRAGFDGYAAVGVAGNGIKMATWNLNSIVFKSIMGIICIVHPPDFRGLESFHA